MLSLYQENILASENILWELPFKMKRTRFVKVADLRRPKTQEIDVISRYRLPGEIDVISRYRLPGEHLR